MFVNKLSIRNYNTNCTKKKNHNTPNFQGNKQKLITDSLKLSSTISASTLFMMAEKDVKDPQIIIDEFYAYENNKVKNLKYNLKRFSEEEKYEINQHIDNINLHPKAFRAIINAKNEDNTYRFDAQESIALFEDVGEQIDKHRDIFQQILDAKDKNGENRFGRKECTKLMINANLLKAYPLAKEAILSVKELSAEDCQSLITETGAYIQELPLILDEAFENLPKDSDDFGKKLIHKIKKIYLEKTNKKQHNIAKIENIATSKAKEQEQTPQKPEKTAQKRSLGENTKIHLKNSDYKNIKLKKASETADVTHSAATKEQFLQEQAKEITQEVSNKKNTNKVFIKNIKNILLGDETLILESGKAPSES